MLDDKRILVVVPARGGSKGVKLKNIHPLKGIPLVAHVGRLIRELPYVDRAVVSTDHPEIARIARESGVDAPFMRPESLSGDFVGDRDVLAHALMEMERIDGATYEVVIMLQPTSPLRRPEHVNAAATELINRGWDAVWTVSLTDLKYHPLKQLKVSETGELEYYEEAGSKIIARQQLRPVYHRNGAAYAFTRECLLEQKTIKGFRTGSIIVNEPMISIDTLEDFRRIEALMKDAYACSE